MAHAKFFQNIINFSYKNLNFPIKTQHFPTNSPSIPPNKKPKVIPSQCLHPQIIILLPSQIQIKKFKISTKKKSRRKPNPKSNGKISILIHSFIHISSSFRVFQFFVAVAALSFPLLSICPRKISCINLINLYYKSGKSISSVAFG